MRHSSPINERVLTEYIRNAKTLAESALERQIVEAAMQLSDQGPAATLAEDDPRKRLFAKLPGLPAVDSWRTFILREFYKALCMKASKYRKSVAELKKNARVFIGVVAGYVAAEAGVAVGVIAALVAALLTLVFQIGLGAFCAGMRTHTSVEA